LGRRRLRSLIANVSEQLALPWHKLRGPRRPPPDGLSIAQAEARIRHRRYEVAHVFDQRGRQLFRQEGDPDAVRFDAADLPLLKDATLLHNHPPHRQYRPDDLRYEGGSFSRSDLDLAVLHDLAALRVVTTSRRHIVVRPRGGWPVDAHTMVAIYLEVEAAVRREFALAVDTGQMTDAETAGALTDEVVERVARTSGLAYQREHW
jgi:hypothetical protein